MRDMWGEKSSGRARYNALVITTTILLVCTILGTTIFFNWIYIVDFFKESKDKIKNWFKDDKTSTTEVVREEVSYSKDDFTELLFKIQKLEELSKEYNEIDYGLRAIVYIRTGKYNNVAFNSVLGAPDVEFEKYVEKNQGELDLVELKYVKDFIIPSTNEKVDFRHMFAAMNGEYFNDQEKSDTAGWAGDLLDLINQFKNSTETGEALLTLIGDQFNGNSSTSTFSNEDVRADFDAVNILDLYDPTSPYTYGTISGCMSNYYDTLNNDDRIVGFRSKTFTGEYNFVADLQEEILTRLKANTYISYLANMYNVDFTTHTTIVDACAQVFAEYIY